MTYLNRKLVRDIRKNWSQFFSVFLMSLLSVLVFVGMQGAWRGLEVSVDRFIDDSNLANYWVQGAGISTADVRKVNQISGIADAERGMRVQAKQGSHVLQIDAYRKPVTHLHSVAGRQYDAHDVGGIWINEEYAQVHHLQPGDTIKISVGGRQRALTVRGTVQSAGEIYYTGTQEFIAPNYSDYGYAYVSPGTMTQKLGAAEAYNVMEIRGSHHDMRGQVEGLLKGRLISYYSRATLPEVSNAVDRVGEIRSLSYLFSFVFILLAVLAMFITIMRLVENQTSEIATLKALGFTNRQVEWHFASFGLVVGGSGVLVGTALSPLISWFILRTQQQMFAIPHWALAYTGSAVSVILGVIGICVAAAYVAAHGATRGLPALFLRGKQPRGGGGIFLERWTWLWSRIPYEGRWALRDIFGNKTRTLMGVIGVAGGMMLMIAGIGMPQSMNHVVDTAYHSDFSYAQRLHIGDYRSYERAHPDSRQWVQTSQAHFSPDDGYDRVLTVVGKGNYVNLKTLDGHAIDDGGLYVTRGFAQRSHISKGDTVTVRTFGQDTVHRFAVKGIVMSETVQGAYITADTWTAAGGLYSPNTLLQGNGGSDAGGEVDSVVSVGEQQRNADDFVGNLTSIFLLIIAFGALLVIVVLYNLGSLSFEERARDYATLQVLGIHSAELRNLTLIENILTTFVGWLIGMPAGIWFLGKYIDTFSTINLEYTRYFNWATIGAASLFVWACALVTTLLISRRIGKLDMVQVLKGVE